MLQVVQKKGHLEHRGHAREAPIREGVRGSSPGMPLRGGRDGGGGWTRNRTQSVDSGGGPGVFPWHAPLGWPRQRRGLNRETGTSAVILTGKGWRTANLFLVEM